MAQVPALGPIRGAGFVAAIQDAPATTAGATEPAEPAL
jgi:hypothetical protein